VKHSNTLIPSIGTDFQEVFEYVTSVATPICLYTYETCNANYNDDGLYVESRDTGTDGYRMMDKEVTSLYGHNKMDNKITLKYEIYKWDDDDNEYTVPVYITYWDGRISISSTVFFFREVTGYNSYRVVHFVYEDGEGAKWYRDQSIGE